MGATHVDARKETKIVEICEELLKRYLEEGDQLLLNIVTGDESWIHHYYTEEKRLAWNTGTLHLLARKNSKQCRLPARFF